MHEPVSPLSTLLLVLASLVFGFGVVLDAMMLLLSVMMFDAPGSEASPYPWIIIGSLLVYPVTVVVGLVRVWRAHKRGDGRAAYKALAIPLAGVLLVLASFRLLQVVCSGNFACH